MLSAAAGPPPHGCLLLTKKKRRASGFSIKYQSWINTGLGGLWLVSLNVSNHREFYIHIYLSICVYTFIYVYTHM